MRITRQVNTPKRASKQSTTKYYSNLFTCFLQIMDIAAWFDDVRRMNKRQVCTASYMVY